ncbi:hypothetical protein SPURM210S_04888 [Streptomyces purpurascens]
MNLRNVATTVLVELSSLHVLASALCSAERGWPVIPLHPGSKRPRLGIRNVPALARDAVRVGTEPPSSAPPPTRN